MGIRSVRRLPAIALAMGTSLIVLTTLLVLVPVREGASTQSRDAAVVENTSASGSPDLDPVRPERHSLDGRVVPATLPNGFRIDGVSFVSPSGERFMLSIEESTDNRSQEEMAWMLRNGVAPISFSGRGGDYADTIDSIRPGDGFDFYEIDRLKSLAMSADPEIRQRALAMLHQAAMLGSIGALDAIANAYAFGPERNPVLSEAYALVAWTRGDWLSTSSRSLAPLGADDRALAALYASQILDSLNESRGRIGLPPLQPDRRPGNSLPPEHRNP